MVWIRELCDKYENYDHPGECSPEKDCLKWHWLTFRQPERKSSSESSKLWNVSRWYICLWLLTWLVNEVEVLLVVCQLSRDVIGCEDCKKWLVRFRSISIQAQDTQGILNERKTAFNTGLPCRSRQKLLGLRSIRCIPFLVYWRFPKVWTCKRNE